MNHTDVPDAAALDAMPYRVAIDRVATLRAQIIRIALNVSLLSSGQDENSDKLLTEMLAGQADKFCETIKVLSGEATFSDLPHPLSAWIADIAAPMQKELKVIQDTCAKTRELLDRTRSDDRITRAELDRFVDLGTGQFFENVSAVTDRLWHSIEDGRARHLAQAAEAVNNVNQHLAQLGRIGRHVRSVSINASVEASRAGQAGRGMSIIAQEFKTLSEDVQRVISVAQEDMSVLGAPQTR